MRKFTILVSLLAASSMLQAAEQSNKLFDCVASDTLAINSDCVESKINQNMQYRDVQQTIYERSESQSNNVMATIKFYPEKYLIEVVAHRDALEGAALLAANRK
ncbi:hypothetical protein [Bowmanella yangjiangensis]|uniref:Pyridine nucleotide transhydrogenase n=1 Tax=Bowmanella yangjiangensis TaxID=2811230 RepID=A0ABS3CZX4_9ALTE|nr:hypothetical protein [Bowmanella yangjiangensis]MBN7821936.1 hypothetical protein [Bowmanella yangjiangensis]